MKDYNYVRLFSELLRFEPGGGDPSDEPWQCEPGGGDPSDEPW